MASAAQTSGANVFVGILRILAVYVWGGWPGKLFELGGVRYYRNMFALVHFEPA
jgi:hypothetical protein